MARYTKCTNVDGIWTSEVSWIIALGVIGAVALLVAGLWAAYLAMAAASITPQSLLIAASILAAACTAGIATLHLIQNYYFDHRLVCIQDRRCALGHVVTIEDNGDGDRSMNLVLAPADFDTTKAEYSAMPQPALLVYGNSNDPDIASIGMNMDPYAIRAEATPSSYGRDNLPFFHCEIEGTYFDTYTGVLLGWLYTLLAFAVAAIVSAALATALGPIAWIIWIAVALFILLAIIFGATLGDKDAYSVEAGPLGDATPSPSGPVITNSDGNVITIGDLVAISGYHVIDTGHNPNCWKELHPVRAVATMTQEDYDKIASSGALDSLYDSYCNALNTFVDNVSTVKLAITAADEEDNQLLLCLEHECVG